MGYLTATAAHAQMLRGELTATRYLQMGLERIQHREPAVKAWAFLAVDAARQQAMMQDRQMQDFPKQATTDSAVLRGVPVAVKDIFATTDMPTTWGMSLYAERYLPDEAIVVKRLREVGAIILGKTITTELAFTTPSVTCNPHNLAHTPGGSSSGSAAAVADGMVPVAIGSQTMGSVLRPAAYCGIFGFKPSFGLISRRGMLSICEELDHVGLFARCLEDIHCLLEVVGFPDGQISAPCRESLGAGGEQGSDWSPRLAWIKTPHWNQVEFTAQTRLHQAMAALSQAGITIETVDLPAICHDYWDTVQTLCAYGLYSHHTELLEQYSHFCSPQLLEWLRRGQGLSLADYERARDRGACYRKALVPIFERYDGILTPVTSGAAPYGLTHTGSPIFCGLWTLCGVPALNLPLGKTHDALPLGCQLIGRPEGDWQCLQIAQHCWSILKAQFGDIEVPPLSPLPGQG